MLSVPERTYRAWTKDKKDEQKRERDRQIFDLWLQCYTQEEIADKFNIDQKTVSNTIDGFRKNGNIAKIPNDFTPQLYDVWTFPKYTGETR